MDDATQNMIYAGFWKRFTASIIDHLIAYLGGCCFYGSIFGVIMISDGADDPDVLEGFVDNPLLSILSIVVSWIYFSVMESSPTQGTLGKMALGIKVTDLEGNRVGFGKATGRYFGKIISMLLLLIGYIMVAFTEKKQGLHDIMAGCLVVNK